MRALPVVNTDRATSMTDPGRLHATSRNGRDHRNGSVLSRRIGLASLPKRVHPSAAAGGACHGTPGMIFIWIGFVVLILGLLALDLGVFNRKAHVIGVKEAL